jgi:hypothetical protein
MQDCKWAANVFLSSAYVIASDTASSVNRNSTTVDDKPIGASLTPSLLTYCADGLICLVPEANISLR